jgi:hypothetical protein
MTQDDVAGKLIRADIQGAQYMPLPEEQLFSFSACHLHYL